MLSLTYLFFGCVISILFILFIRYKIKRRILSTFSLFCIVYIFSYFFVPAYSSVYNYSRYGIEYSDMSKYITLLYSILFFLFTLIYYMVFSKRFQTIRIIKIEEMKLKTFYFFGAICFCLCLFSLIKISSLIFSYGLNVFLSNRIILTSGMGYFQLLLYFPLLWTIVFVIEHFHIRSYTSWINYCKGILLVSAASLPLVVLGSRSNVLFGIIIYSFSVLVVLLKTGNINHFSRKIKKITLILIGVILFGASLGEVRQKLMAEDASNYATQEEKMPFESVVKAFSSYENLYWFFTDGNKTELQYGGTLVSVFVGPIPRSIWSEKPTGGGPVMKNHISPGSYDLALGEKISSYTTGLPAEGYLNFGFIGVLIAPFILVLIVFLHESVLNNACNSLEIVVSVALLLRILGFVNAEYYGVFIHIFVIVFFYASYRITRVRFKCQF